MKEQKKEGRRKEKTGERDSQNERLKGEID